MHIEFRSDRPPGPPPAPERLWERRLWPGITIAIAGALVYGIGDSPLAIATLSGEAVGTVGVVVIARAITIRRRRTTVREPRQWTISDDELWSRNRLRSVRWNWSVVERVDELSDVYLLYPEGAPHGFPFDIPRDALTAEQDRELRAVLVDRGLLAAVQQTPSDPT
jgi:hypothetical protein